MHPSVKNLKSFSHRLVFYQRRSGSVKDSSLLDRSPKGGADPLREWRTSYITWNEGGKNVRDHLKKYANLIVDAAITAFVFVTVCKWIGLKYLIIYQ